MSVVIGIIAVGALVLAGWLRAAGTAIAHVPRADALRDESDGVSGAARVAELLDERDVIGPSVGVIVSALQVTAAVLGTVAIVKSVSSPDGASLLAAVGTGLVVFLLSDLIPRRIGRQWPRQIAYRSPNLVALSVRFGSWAVDLLPETGDEPQPSQHKEPMEPDDEHERELIDSVLDFSETLVREVMTPRPDMVTVPIEASIDTLVATASDEGFSRVPVVSDDDVVGMVMVKDLLPLLSEGQRPSLREVMRPVDFVPESKLASVLLAEMQGSHSHQVIVVDEYGDVAGLVTIEDLLEELVGEIADETDEEEVFVTDRGDGSWDIDARLPVDDLADITGVELPDEDWDTVGGLVLALAERVPEVGEEFAHGSLTLAVLRMQGRRISEVRARVSAASE